MAKPGARVILVAKVLISCIQVGLAKSFGVLVPELEKQLQTSKAIVGLIISLMMAIPFLGSPIAKMLLHRCSNNQRVLTSFCGLAAGCSLVATSFTRNIAFMGVLFISVGLCLSVIHLQALVLLHQYYPKDFAFASCISLLGIPVGSAILPPIMETFLEHYGLNGTLMLDGALLLNMLPVGLMLRVPRKRGPSLAVGISPTDGTKFDKPTGSSNASMKFSEKCELPLREGHDHPDAEVDSKSYGDESRTRRELWTVKYNHYVAIHDSGLKLPSQRCHGNICNEIATEYIKDGKRNDSAINKSDSVISLQDSWSFTKVGDEDESVVSSCLSYFHLDVIIKEPLFSIIYFPVIVVLFLVTGGWALFVVLDAVEHGIDIARGTYLATSGAIGGILASILISVGLHYRPKWSPHFWIVSNILYAVIFFLQTLSSSYGYLLAMSFCIGFGLFAVNIMLEAVMALIVDEENFPNASNLFFVAVGIGYLASGYVAGDVQDRTGNTEALFIFLGVLSTMGLGLFSAMIIIFKRKRLCLSQCMN